MSIFSKIASFKLDGYTVNFLDDEGNTIDTADIEDIVRTYIDLMKEKVEL